MQKKWVRFNLHQNYPINASSKPALSSDASRTKNPLSEGAQVSSATASEDGLTSGEAAKRLE